METSRTAKKGKARTQAANPRNSINVRCKHSSDPKCNQREGRRRGGDPCGTGRTQRIDKPLNRSTLKLLYTNATSIVNKTETLIAFACDLKPDIIVITETWTHPGISQAHLDIPGYEIVSRSDRTDTKKGRGGGVLIYSNQPNIYANPSTSPFSQHASVTISSGKREPSIKLHVLYRSPNSSEQNNEDLLDYIKSIPENSILLGDYNFPEINWETLSTSTSSTSPSSKFIQATQDKFLNQLVTFIIRSIKRSIRSNKAHHIRNKTHYTLS